MVIKALLDDAEEYELFGYPATTMQDCDFLEDIISTVESPSPVLLDIACGTGRHAIEMARRGYTVTALDNSETMLQTAMRNINVSSDMINYDLCDMRKMLYKTQFDVAYMLFNTMGLLTGNEEIAEFLNRVWDALKPDGLFVFQVGNLWSYIAAGDFSNSVYESEQKVQGIKRKLVMHMTIGPYNNIYRMQYEKQYWHEGQEMEPKIEIVDLRIFSLNELDILLESSGFQRLKVFGETDISSVIDMPNVITLDKDGYHSYVVVAVKRNKEINNNDGEFMRHSKQWTRGHSRNSQSHHTNNARRSIPLGISQCCTSTGNRRIGWRRR